MRLSRRQLLLSSPVLAGLASCATDFSRYRSSSVQELAISLGVCAVSYAVIKAGKMQPVVTLSGCGATSLQAGAVFQAASLTKPVVAYAALRMVLEDRLNLRAPVSAYLPSGYTHFHNVLARKPGDASDHVQASVLDQIPVASLLNHSSGLPNWVSGKLIPNFKPGERWQYSGEGFVLLQTVIEAISGMSITQYMDEQVFKPLGMHDSSLIWQDRFSDRIQIGVTSFGSTNKLRFTSPVAAASLYSTASDYAQFLVAVLGDKKLLPLTVAQPIDVDHALGLAWGHGWGVERTEAGVNLWQWGNNPGYRNFVMISPASQDGFVIFANSDRAMALAVPLAYEVLLGEHPAFEFPMVQ